MEVTPEGEKPQKPWTPEDEKTRLLRLRVKEGDVEWAIETGITAYELSSKIRNPEQVFEALRTAQVLGPMFDEIGKNEKLTEYFTAGINIGYTREQTALQQSQKSPGGPQNPSPQKPSA